MADILAVARELADDVLFPDAMRVDRLDVLPAAHLDACAAAGLYGAPVPVDAGGLGLDLRQVGDVVEELDLRQVGDVVEELDLRQVGDVVEELAGGCLAAAFVLIQHFRLVTSLAADGAPAAMRDRWLPAGHPAG